MNVDVQKLESVCARIAGEQALRQEGVHRLRSTWCERIGVRRPAGAVACIDRQGWVNIDVAIVAARHNNLRQLGIEVQKSVRNAVRNATRQPLGRVNVRITGIRR
ncbi:MAG TPA: Asp23/Gls24 family envelope stress response protein [Candidatus Hydrogenedentes bacterium]|nr:Asp23/Gls24 family envelope stress response protein [Candidatus Hydrogenedentota bacterium]HOV73373.1 Asp23/Gls24 family envelope stress response protein [Candidatus Hydrogenedentota bacterium]